VTLRLQAAVGAAGLGLVGLLCAALGLSAAESVQLAGIAMIAALAAGLTGAVVLRVLRTASFSIQIAVPALTSLAAVAAGALAASNAMLLSTPDFQALSVIVLAAGTVGLVSALALSARVGAASRALGEAARRIGEGGAPRGERPFIPEFAEIAAQLEDSAARLEEARERERVLDASRRELVAWVSHDLRTPLAGIRAITEALEDEVVTDALTVQRYHRTLRREADRLAGLVDDLFELSRIHAGALRLEFEPADLGDLVSDAVAAADPLAAAKGVRLEGRMVGPAPQLALAAAEFGRVLRNLLENAIRETPPDGAVTVEAGTDGKRAYVAVSDTCGGIPDADLPRVFDTAFRGQAARTPTGDAGSGLGLAIARGLVKAHDGDIAVSNEGGGCRFVVRVPLTAGSR